MLPILSLCLLAGLILGACVYLFQSSAIKSLTQEFKRKVTMTVSLGTLFFGCYLLLVSVGSYLAHNLDWHLFDLLQGNPTLFTYAGLWLFAVSSLMIYLVRMIVKYLYLTHGKDS